VVGAASSFYRGASVTDLNPADLRAEPLIQAAVFGLFRPSTPTAAARRITVPIEFALQCDDEHIPRGGGLARFDAFAATEKSPHVNAGKHMELPPIEAASAVRFFQRHVRG
jgi:hypothetical protein